MNPRRGETARKLPLALAAGLVLALATGTTVAAKARHHHPRRALVHGVVQSVSTDSITLTRRNGTSVTIGVTSRTRVVVNRTRATLAAVKVGYRAVVLRAANGTARAIRAFEKGHGGLHLLVRGVVKAVGTDSITLQRRNGASVTVPVDAKTRVLVDRQPATLAELHEGYRAIVVRAPGEGPALAIVAHAPH